MKELKEEVSTVFILVYSTFHLILGSLFTLLSVSNNIFNFEAQKVETEHCM